MKIDKEELAEIISDGRFNGKITKLIDSLDAFVEANKINNYMKGKEYITEDTFEFDNALYDFCDCIIDIVSGDEDD